MDIKSFLPSKDKKDKGKLYWALLIEPDWVQAGIWSIVDDKAQNIASSPPTAWELDDELIQAADTALSSAIQNLSPEAKEPSKTVFGVVSSWVEKGEIKQKYLEIIKDVCSNLSLEPVGFVVLSEAISHLIKVEEGSSLNAVVLGISDQNIELSIFKLGNLVGTSQVARSVSVVDDVIEGLARFSGQDPMPSRFLLYNGKEGELEDIRQSLIKGNWEDLEKVKLLHSPKIETITPEKKVNAVVLAGASEIANISILVDEIRKDRLDEDIKQKEVFNLTSDVKPISAEELGFVLGKDVVAEGRSLPEVQEEVLAKKPIDSEKTKTPTIAREEIKSKPFSFKLAEKPSFGFVNRIKSKVVDGLISLSEKFPGKIKIGRRPFLIGGVLFLVVFLGGGLFYWYYPKATVTIYVSTQELNEKIDFSINPIIDTPNFSEKILPGEVLTKSLLGERTKSTTGTKTVGDKAKGEVVFYRVGSPLTLPVATLLVGPGNLKYSLDESTTVASGSASSPGTTAALVTAEDIGAQYNLAANSSFTVTNYSTSDIEAKNNNAFSGGSSREISAVAEEDQKILEEELSQEIKDKAMDEFKAELADNLFLIEDSISTSPSSLDFSNKVGDEASTLKLLLTLEVRVIAVGKDALTEFSKEALADKVPSGFVLRNEQIDFDFDFKEEVEGVYLFGAQTTANLLPEINSEEVAEKVAGKYPQLAKNYLTEEIPGFVRAEVSFKPKLPGRLGTLPRVAKNIEIVISSER